MKPLEFLKSNKHIVFILYFPIYLYCFCWLEARDDVSFTTIHCFVDDWIPFMEIFIIPYLLWFLYVVVVLMYLYLQKQHLEDYYHCVVVLILGMSTCLLIYYLFPNAQNMRPTEFAHPNVFTDIISFIYESDTDTNVLPSIHVFNAVAIHGAFSTSYYFRNRRKWKLASLILCILICLSTMFLKQHSFLDVITAVMLYAVYYELVYHLLPRFWQWHKEKRQRCVFRKLQ